jgi:hypothetical protein
MIHLIFTDSERLALAGSLAGYRCLTREAYALDLRQFTTWCRGRSLPLFAVRRAEIESFARTRTAVLAWVGAERDGAQRDPEVVILGPLAGASRALSAAAGCRRAGAVRERRSRRWHRVIFGFRGWMG